MSTTRCLGDMLPASLLIKGCQFRERAFPPPGSPASFRTMYESIGRMAWILGQTRRSLVYAYKGNVPESLFEALLLGWDFEQRDAFESVKALSLGEFK